MNFVNFVTEFGYLPSFFQDFSSSFPQLERTYRGLRPFRGLWPGWLQMAYVERFQKLAQWVNCVLKKIPPVSSFEFLNFLKFWNSESRRRIEKFSRVTYCAMLTAANRANSFFFQIQIFWNTDRKFSFPVSFPLVRSSLQIRTDHSNVTFERHVWSVILSSFMTSIFEIVACISWPSPSLKNGLSVFAIRVTSAAFPVRGVFRSAALTGWSFHKQGQGIVKWCFVL